MPEQFRSEFRAARKAHQCGMCCATIEAGERHHVSTNVFDGRVYDFRTCAGCEDDRILAEVYAWCYSPDEGVNAEAAFEWAHEHLEHEQLGEAARRWLTRAGCRCEQCTPDQTAAG